MKVELAQKYATKYHQGQFRKNGVTPYIVHPHAVVKYLEKFGIKDEVTLSIAWLHDIVEDTEYITSKSQKYSSDDIDHGTSIDHPKKETVRRGGARTQVTLTAPDYHHFPPK